MPQIVARHVRRSNPFGPSGDRRRQGGTQPRIQVESTRVKCGFLSSRGTEHLQGVNHRGCWQGLVTLPVRIPMPLGVPVMLLDPRPGSLTGSSHATSPSFRCSSGSNVLAEKGLAGASAGDRNTPSRALHVLLVGTTWGPSPSVMPSQNRCSGAMRCPTRLCPSSFTTKHKLQPQNDLGRRRTLRSPVRAPVTTAPRGTRAVAALRGPGNEAALSGQIPFCETATK